MDDLKSRMYTKIRTLEPENATRIIEYLQNMEDKDLIRIAIGPDILLQTFCQKAKYDLGISSINPNSSLSRLIHPQPFSQSSSSSSSKNEFLKTSLTPKPLNRSKSLSFSFTPFGDESSFFSSSSSSRDIVREQQVKQHDSFDPVANFHKRSLSAYNSQSRGTGVWFPHTGLDQHQQRQPCGSQMSQTQTAIRSGNFGDWDSATRQILMTFASESSFTDHDIISYFSKFGNVEEVKIPYRKKRTFGFVTFGNSETVRILLAQENPHFICGSAVHVTPQIQDKPADSSLEKPEETGQTRTGTEQNKAGSSNKSAI